MSAGRGEEPVRPLEVGAMGDGAEEPVGEAEEREEEQAEHGSRIPAKGKDPKPLSTEEIKEHEMTHLPYRSRCVPCVRGTGRSMDHRKADGERRVHEVHLDYCCLGTAGDGKT